MSILTNIIEQEQLTIATCYAVENGAWKEFFRNVIVDQMHDYIMDELESRYGWSDPTNIDLFATIVNDVPGLIGDYLYGMGHITKACRDGFAIGAWRDVPFWGVPEVPQFSIPIRLRVYDSGPWIHTYISNKMWESRWRGIDPIIYDRFIHYIRGKWVASNQFCHNPNPWKILQNIIDYPDKYKEYGYIKQ